MITIDYRESQLISLVPNCVSSNLEVGDIQISLPEGGDDSCDNNDGNNNNKRKKDQIVLFCFERKTIADYYGSRGNHLKNQILRMKAWQEKEQPQASLFLILEGEINSTKPFVVGKGRRNSLFSLPSSRCLLDDLPVPSSEEEPPSFIYNSLVNRMVDDKLTIIRSKDLNETAIWMNKFALKASTMMMPVAAGTDDNNNGKLLLLSPPLSSSSYLETIKVKKSDNIDPKVCFLLQLRVIPGVSVKIAEEIGNLYPTGFRGLLEGSQKGGELFLADLILSSSKRKLGPVVSKRIYHFLNHS